MCRTAIFPPSSSIQQGFSPLQWCLRSSFLRLPLSSRSIAINKKPAHNQPQMISRIRHDYCDKCLDLWSQQGNVLSEIDNNELLKSLRFSTQRKKYNFQVQNCPVSILSAIFYPWTNGLKEIGRVGMFCSV